MRRTNKASVSAAANATAAYSKPHERTPQGFESALLVGGATSAVGLFVGRIALTKARESLRRMIDVFIKEPAHSMQYTITRDFLSVDRQQQWHSTGIVARDTALGGAMLLVPGGVFYLSAPSYTMYELNFSTKADAAAAAAAAAAPAPAEVAVAPAVVDTDASTSRRRLRAAADEITVAPQSPRATAAQQRQDAMRKVYMLPHAYFLYQKAHCWLDEPDILAMRERFSSFAADCLLHMLLNDYRYAWTQMILPEDMKAAVVGLFEALMGAHYRKPAVKQKSWYSYLFGHADSAPSPDAQAQETFMRTQDNLARIIPQKSTAVLSKWYKDHGSKKSPGRSSETMALCIARALEQDFNTHARASSRYAMFQRPRVLDSTQQENEAKGLERIGCSFVINAGSESQELPFRVFLEISDAAPGSTLQPPPPKGDATSHYFLDNYSSLIGRLAYRYV